MPYETGGLAPLSTAVGVVVVLLWVALWALRRARPNGGPQYSPDCTIVRALSVGPKERLLVVAIGAKQVVLGVGNGSISLLLELAEPLVPPTPRNNGFGEVMRRARQQWRAQ